MAGQKFTVGHDAPLLVYLFEILPTQSRTSVKNMLSKGQVLVNGERITAFDAPLKAGDGLIILPKGISIARTVKAEAKDELQKNGVLILYEDADYIVVDKPSGMLCVSSAKGSSAKSGHKERTLYALLNAYVKLSARMQRKEDLLSGVVTFF